VKSKLDDAKLDAISFQQLTLFEAVGRIQSVRRASEQCNLSQPAVTQAISKLERQLGDQLLQRRASGSYLTDLGEIFHRRVVRFFEKFDAALSRIPISGGPAVLKSTSKRISRSQARGLIALVENGALDRAALALGVSQTSLQRTVRTLEQNVHKSLMCRTAAGISITPIGNEFGKSLKLALQEIEMGRREMEIARGSAKSRLTIGAMPLGGSVLLASALDELMSAYPDVEVKIVSGNSPELLESLGMGDVDFVVGLVKKVDDSEFEYEALAETPYSIVCRRGHALLKKPRVKISDLLKHDWIIGTKGASRREAFETLFADSPGPRAKIRTSSLPVIQHLLESSDRLTLMTSYELVFEGADLAELDFGPISPIPSIGITTRANWLPIQIQQDLMELIRNRAATARNRAVQMAS